MTKDEIKAHIMKVADWGPGGMLEGVADDIADSLAKALAGPPPEVETSDRGFKHYAPVKSTYGDEVQVYESSAAMAPHLWVAIEGNCHLSESPVPHPGIPFGIAKGHSAAHLTLESAAALRDELTAAIAGHYQLEDE